MALVHRGQGETKERDSHSRVVGGRFHKQRNLHMRLILGCHKTRRSPHPPARILKVDIETLPGFSSVYRADDLSNTWLSRGCVLENDSHCGNTTHALQGQGRRWGDSNCPGPAFSSTGDRVLSMTSSNTICLRFNLLSLYLIHHFWLLCDTHGVRLTRFTCPFS